MKLEMLKGVDATDQYALTDGKRFVALIPAGENQHKDAKEITLAVNSHDQLVAALNASVAEMCRLAAKEALRGGDTSYTDEVYKDAKQALANATQPVEKQ